MAKVITLSITQISRPADLQMRESLRTDHINDMAEALARGDELPAVRVVRDGNAYWLWDGHHRVAAHETAEVQEVKVEITQDGTREDARWLACSANKDHDALKRSAEDKRKAVHKALEAWPKKTDRAIADHVGVDHKTVKRHRPSGEKSGEFPNAPSVKAPEKRKTKDGREYPASRPSKPKTADSTPEPGDKAKKASSKSAEPATDPITEIGEQVDQIIGELKAVQSTMRSAFGFVKDKQTNEYKNNGKHAYTYSGTIGQVGSVISTLKDEKPVEIQNGKVITKRAKQLQDSVKGGKG